MNLLQKTLARMFRLTDHTTDYWRKTAQYERERANRAELARWTDNAHHRRRHIEVRQLHRALARKSRQLKRARDEVRVTRDLLAMIPEADAPVMLSDIERASTALREGAPSANATLRDSYGTVIQVSTTGE